jgi:hypothetical protein
MRTGAIVLAFASLASAAFADQRAMVPLEWDELPDPLAQVYEDPFLDLSTSQMTALLTLVQMREKLARDDLSTDTREGYEARLSEVSTELSAQEIDFDWLISQRWVVTERREAAAAAGNPSLDGQTISIAGFAIPTSIETDGTRIAYLVPTPGMCSHLPPPDPNQLIRVRLGEDWAPKYFHEPVRLSGRLHLDPTTQSLWLVDGTVPMQATWTLDVEDAVTAFAAPAKGTATNRWADVLRESLRASSETNFDNRKTGGVEQRGSPPASAETSSDIWGNQ